ncbi:MAG: hypothetical protein V9E81_17055 [Marmoricola sp.]
MRVLLAIATVTLALGIVQKAPCVRTQWGDTELRYGAMCYSDIPYLYTGRGMAERVWPYSDTQGRYEVMEYPVGISYFAYAAAELTSVVAVGPTQSEREHVPPDALWGLPGMTAEVNQYFVVNAILLAALGLLGAFPGGRQSRSPLRCGVVRGLTVPACGCLHQLGHARGGLRRRRAVGVGSRAFDTGGGASLSALVRR